MDLLAYWKWNAYQTDTANGRQRPLHFNSNKVTLHNKLEYGDSLWLVAGRPGNHGHEYWLAARLIVIDKTRNDPEYQYGEFRIVGDPARSTYFESSGPDMVPVLNRLQFFPNKPLSVKDRKDVAMALRATRALTNRDVEILSEWSRNLTQI